MTSDEAIARSVVIGHEVKERILVKFPDLEDELVQEIQHQSELSYLQAVNDVYVDIVASSVRSGPLDS